MQFRPLLLVYLICIGASVSASTIRLKNGTILKGEVLQDNGSQVTIKADLIGEITIARSDIDNTSRETQSAEDDSAHAAKSAAMEQVTAPDPVTVARAETAKDPDKPYVKRSLSFNGNYSTANFKQGALGTVPPGFPDTGAGLGLQGVTYNYGVSGLYIRATKNSVIEARANYNQAEYEPAGTVVDAYGAEASYLNILKNPNRYYFGSISYNVDEIALIDHELETLFGYGFKLIDKPGIMLDFGPGIALSESEKGTAYDGDWIVSGGFFERFEYHFNERVSIEQRLKYRIGFEETEVWKADAEIKLRAALSKSIAFTITGNYIYDNTLGPIPSTILDSLPPFYGIYSPAEKGRLTIQSGIEWDF